MGGASPLRDPEVTCGVLQVLGKPSPDHPGWSFLLLTAFPWKSEVTSQQSVGHPALPSLAVA